MGHRVLVLASYCGDENPNCSADFPCDECLHDCNIAEANLVTLHGGFDYMRQYRPTNRSEGGGDG